jgi:hypothetical protein
MLYNPCASCVSGVLYPVCVGAVAWYRVPCVSRVQMSSVCLFCVGGVGRAIVLLSPVTAVLRPLSSVKIDSDRLALCLLLSALSICEYQPYHTALMTE